MSKILKFFLGIGIISLTVAGCKKDDEVKIIAPSVTTNEVSAITYSSAIINGDVSSDGGTEITARGFVWNISPDPTLSNFNSVDENKTTGSFNLTLTGLIDQTVYYYRAYATNSEGTSYGNEASFTTLEMSNFMLYEGLKYNLDNGIIDFYGQYNDNPASYNFDITLHSSGIDFDDEGLTGQGHAILWELFSSSATDLVPGTYTFDVNETYIANTFDYGISVFNFNSTTQTGNLVFITGGTVTIEKEGSIYTITAVCTTEDNKTITGNYTGSLTFYDYSEMKKSSKNKRFE